MATESFELEAQSGDQSTTATQPGQGIDLSKYVPIENFTGLQGHAKKVQTENQQLKSRIHDLTTDYEGKLTMTVAEKEAAIKQLEDYQKQFEQAEQKLKFYQHREEVGRVVEEKFPGLARLHSKNLLRTEGLEGEELEAFLREYSETVEQLGTDKRRQQGSGATPTPPVGAPAAKTPDDLYVELQRLRPGTEAYDTKFAEYSAALALESDKLTFD